MARIRTIKPEFPQSESMGRVSRDARLLFIMLWPICDDHGRTRAASLLLARLLFPYDRDAEKLIDGWLVELEREGCIARYKVDGSTFLQVLNWSKHQKIDKPSKPQFPEPSGEFAAFREDSRGFVVGKEGKGKEGNGEDAPSAPAPTEAEKPEAQPKAHRLPEGWKLPRAWGEWAEFEMGLEREAIRMEAASFRDHWKAKSGKDACKLDWEATWRNWIRRYMGYKGLTPSPREKPINGNSGYISAMDQVRALGLK